jgi:hypothetical protein
MFLPPIGCERPLVNLPNPMRSECVNADRRQVYRAFAVLGFQILDNQSDTFDSLDGCSHTQNARVEIHVRPAEAKTLAGPQPNR